MRAKKIKLLIENWKPVLKRSLSVWFAVLATIFGGIDLYQKDILELFSVLQPLLPDGAFQKLSLLFAALVPLARIKRQASLHVEEAK